MQLPERTQVYETAVFDTRRWDQWVARPGDVFVCTPAKAGTTWTQMLCALVVHRSTTFPQPLTSCRVGSNDTSTRSTRCSPPTRRSRTDES